MLKKFFIFWLVVGVLVYFTWDFIMTDKCSDFILSHPKASWAPGSMYYLGNIFLILQRREKAEKAYENVIKVFPDTQYYERAYYNYFYLAADDRRRIEARERGHSYIEKFPDSPNIGKVEKKLDILNKF